MQSDPRVGFQGRHTNWLAISGPLLAIGGTGIVALAAVVLTVTNFKPSSLFWTVLGACAACALAGAYITVAVFTDWPKPLPEPGPETRRVWRLGVLIIFATVCIVLLYFLQGVLSRYVPVAQAVVVGAFIIAALISLAFSSTAPGERGRAKLPSSEQERDEIRLAPQRPSLVSQDLLAEAAREAEMAGIRDKIDALTQQRDAAQVQRDAYKEQLDSARQQRDDAQRQLAERKGETATAQPFSQTAGSLPPYEVPDSVRDEVQRRFPQRNIVVYSVIELASIAKLHMTEDAKRLLAPKIDNGWKIVTGELVNYEVYGDTIVVRLKNEVQPDVLLVPLSFDCQPWLLRIEKTPRSTKLIVIGQIKKVEAQQVFLEHCEML